MACVAFFFFFFFFLRARVLADARVHRLMKWKYIWPTLFPVRFPLEIYILKSTVYVPAAGYAPSKRSKKMCKGNL